MNKELKKEFENQLNKTLEKNSIQEMESFLLNSSFKNFSQKYKQSVMDYFVCNGYTNEKSELFAKWSLTNKTLGINGNIHENADRPLRLASKFNIDFAKYLLTSTELSENSNINETNDGSSALLDAIKTKNLDFVKYLISSSELKIKAQIDLADNDFDDPLCKACDVNSTEIVKYLLSDECYPDQNKFNPQNNIARFDYHSINKIIYNDNIELLKFIIDKKFLNITTDLHNWFCKAVISDSIQVANYLEKLFEIKPNLKELKYQEKSLFFMIAQSNHYGRMENHSFLQPMLEDANSILNTEEINEMNHFYIYHTDKSATPLSYILDICKNKKILEKKLVFNNTQNKLNKI